MRRHSPRSPARTPGANRAVGWLRALTYRFNRAMDLWLCGHDSYLLLEQHQLDDITAAVERRMKQRARSS